MQNGIHVWIGLFISNPLNHIDRHEQMFKMPDDPYSYLECTQTRYKCRVNEKAMCAHFVGLVIQNGKKILKRKYYYYWVSVQHGRFILKCTQPRLILSNTPSTGKVF